MAPSADSRRARSATLRTNSVASPVTGTYRYDCWTVPAK